MRHKPGGKGACGHGTVLTHVQIQCVSVVLPCTVLNALQSSQEAVDSVVALAVRMSQSAQHDSPFAKKARQNKLQFSGGKPDDITVVMAVVEQEL